MNTTDSFDDQLVRLLGQDARQNSQKLAKKLNVSSATIRRRLRKLLQNGWLRIIGVVDPAKFGFPLRVVLALDVAGDKLSVAMEALSNKKEIRWLSSTTGRWDVVAIAGFASTDELSRFLLKDLSEIEGVRDTETLICLDMKKGHFSPIEGTTFR